MTHESFERRTAVKISSDRSFGILFAVVFAVIAVWPLFFGENLRSWSAGISIAILTVAITRPHLLRPANKLWMRLGALLHSIASPIALGVMFFLVVTPVGLLMRMCGKRPLALTYDKDASTYWIERTPESNDPMSLKDQF